MTFESHTATKPELTVLLEPAELRDSLVRDVVAGLATPPRHLPPKYFYDDRGSRLFEEITRLSEYYPTRAERALLLRYAEQVAAEAGADVLLELGSGSSEKTRILLDALARAGSLAAYVAVDVSPGALVGARASLGAERPELPVHAVVADFERHLADLPAPGRRLVAFLGGTIGNLQPRQRATFLAEVAATMRPGECLLVGLDLVKDPTRLVAAYDDAAGVTAAFNKNVLRVLNRELHGDLDESAFSHVATWNPAEEWIEMRLRADRPVTARLAAIDLGVTFALGEEIRTETSAKFRRAGFEQELEDAGLVPAGWWTDGDYALALARR